MKGLILVFFSGLAGGAFPLPGKRISEWQWEHVWAVYSLLAMCVLPITLALVVAPTTISSTGNDPVLVVKVVGYGMLFGLGSVLFGLSLARLGMAITNALVSGIIVFLGSVGPLLIGSVYLDAQHVTVLIVSLSMLVASLILCCSAAISRDKARAVDSPAAAGSGSFLAVLIAVLAGCFSAMLNIAFTLGTPLANRALAAGCLPLSATLAIWVPALLGGTILNVGYPLYQVGRQRSWRLFFAGPHYLRSWLMASLMAFLWFGNILLYGFGASFMTAGAVYGWAISSAVSILTSNALGALAGEWRGAGPTAKRQMALSTVLLIVSFVLLASQSISA